MKIAYMLHNVETNRDGKSLEDLRNEILGQIKNKNLKDQFELVYYKTIGEIREDINEYKFDYLCYGNIKYFDLINVPRLKEKPMAGVKKIKFQSDLTGIKSVNQFDEDSFIQIYFSKLIKNCLISFDITLANKGGTHFYQSPLISKITN